MNSADPGNADSRRRQINGRPVVLGMFAFGVLMTSALVLYWELYTRPFRALQTAIDEAYPGSSPRVIGGRPKSHKAGTPNVLRIVVCVDFDPTDLAISLEADAVVSRIEQIAHSTMDMSGYDTLEVHLLQRVPEQENRLRAYELPLKGDASFDDGLWALWANVSDHCHLPTGLSVTLGNRILKFIPQWMAECRR